MSTLFTAFQKSQAQANTSGISGPRPPLRSDVEKQIMRGLEIDVWPFIGSLTTRLHESFAIVANSPDHGGRMREEMANRLAPDPQAGLYISHGLLRKGTIGKN